MVSSVYTCKKAIEVFPKALVSNHFVSHLHVWEEKDLLLSSPKKISNSELFFLDSGLPPKMVKSCMVGMFDDE